MLKEVGGDSTPTPFFSPSGVLKQGGKVSTERRGVEIGEGEGRRQETPGVIRSRSERTAIAACRNS